MLGHHFETKTPATNRTCLFWGTTSRPRYRRQIVHCWGATSRPRHRQQIVHLNAWAPLRDQDTGNKSYILVLGHHFETKTPATKRISQCWCTTSRPRHRQQIVHLSAWAPLRDQDTGNKSYMFVLGHHFETKTPATNRTCLCWGTTSRPRYRRQIVHCWGAISRPRHRQQIVHFNAGHHFETKTPATNRTS